MKFKLRWLAGNKPGRCCPQNRTVPPGIEGTLLAETWEEAIRHAHSLVYVAACHEPTARRMTRLVIEMERPPLIAHDGPPLIENTTEPALPGATG